LAGSRVCFIVFLLFFFLTRILPRVQDFVLAETISGESCVAVPGTRPRLPGCWWGRPLIVKVSSMACISFNGPSCSQRVRLRSEVFRRIVLRSTKYLLHNYCSGLPEQPAGVPHSKPRDVARTWPAGRGDLVKPRGGLYSVA
jgi:hypothetical protein